MKVGGTLNENCFCRKSRTVVKTTMYNALTGRNERVGNWAGVTIDKKRKSDQERIIMTGRRS